MKNNTRNAMALFQAFMAFRAAIIRLCITQRNAGRRILGAGALGLASLLGPSQSDGAILVTNTPFIDSSDNTAINLSVKNDDEGAIYNSAELNVFKDLASQLFALPANQDNYSSIADLMSGWNFVIAPGVDFVNSGWNYEKKNDGSISLTNVGGKNADEWNSNDGSNTQLYTITIPKTQLDFTGVAGYDPAKAGIVLSSETKPNMFIGKQGDGSNVINYPAEGLFYQVQIPEPSTYAAIIGLLAGAGAMYRRRQKNSLTHTQSEENSIDQLVKRN
ncbi:MAG: PEP-CTERM sorting domain-containing protein [Opitutales bacterium]|nr:PEP-CTERM sorting domain-containing protein [Opitutales bacterium]